MAKFANSGMKEGVSRAYSELLLERGVGGEDQRARRRD